jgi:hypothetical protein
MSSELEQRFFRFLELLPGTESLDTLLASSAYEGERRADYLLFDRKVIIEVKSLEIDTSPKIEIEMEPHRERDDFPLFYGEVALEKVLKHLPDGKKINERIFYRTTRSIEGAAKSAEKQIVNTAKLLNLTESVGVLVLLNQHIDIFTPEVLAHRVASVIRRKNEDGSSRSPIAFTWAIFESHHVTNGPASKTLPMLSIEGARAPRYLWFDGLLDYLMSAWAHFNGYPLFQADGSHPSRMKVAPTKGAEHSAPGEKVTKQRLWELQYDQNPYLRDLTDEEVLRRGRVAIEALRPHFLKGGPGWSDEAEPRLIAWSHFLCEARHRGLDLRHIPKA